MNKVTIQIRGLSKTYRRKNALSPLELEISEGVTGILGPNGAGKSTFLSLLATVALPSHGTATLYGNPLQGDGTHHIRNILGYLPQRVHAPGKLSAEEFLNYAAVMKGIHDDGKRVEEVSRVLSVVNLLDRSRDRIKGYSGGMRQRIGIAQALIGKPNLLLFDEPTTGLDPAERIAFRNLIRDLGQTSTVLMSTHIVSDLESTCDQVIIINQGELCFQGTLEELATKALGKVWEAVLSTKDAESWYTQRAVVAGIREANGMRVRIISEKRPVAEATEVSPSLEDGYVAVIKGLIG